MPKFSGSAHVLQGPGPVDEALAGMQATWISRAADHAAFHLLDALAAASLGGYLTAH
jgi:hypothetical protein